MNILQYQKEYGLFALHLPKKAEGRFELGACLKDGKYVNAARIEAESGVWRCVPNWRFLILGDGGEDCVLHPNDSVKLQDKQNNDILSYYIEDMEPAQKVLRKYCLPSEGEFVIGGQGSLLYNSEFVAAQHARLFSQNRKWYIEDLESPGGTYLNNRPLRRQEMRTGDVVRVFELQLIFMGNILAINQPRGFEMREETLKEYRPLHPTESFDPLMHLSDPPVRFERAPRILDKYTPADIQLVAPPASNRRERTPAVLMMGTSLTMGVTSMITASNALQNAMTNGGGIGPAIPSLIMSASMLTGSLIFPMLNRRYEEKREMQEEERRSEKYKTYLDDVRRKISKALSAQKKNLLENFASVQECCTWIENRSLRLFNRTPSDSDFLTLRLGIGTRELDGDIRFPHTELNLMENNLEVLLRQMEEEPRQMEDAPITISLMEHRVLGLVGQRERIVEYAFELLLQLCSQHSPDEVKLVLIVPEEETAQWEYARWFPHVWNNEHDFRLIVSKAEDAYCISTYLEAVLMRPSEGFAKWQVDAHYIIVSADARLSSRIPVLRQLLKNVQNVPVSVIALNERLAQLPVECSSIIEIMDKEVQIYNKQIQSYQLTMAGREASPYASARRYSTQLANLCVGVSDDGFELPASLTFMDLFKCSNLEQLRILDKWKESNPIKTLAVPLGYDQFGDEFCLDIHQDAHGPHGLIAGTTGSGKSEWIISYILSMAMHYSPLEVGFVLIDYKGGGMSDTFKDLPHVVGIIDNLGGHRGIHRSMTCIESELARRQELFKRISEEQKISNIDIHKYQKLYREGRVAEPLQHLIVISDEFAELKQQEEGFIDKLVSAARIGRSLGVHLILATQKPSGVVNEQIVSNSRFRVCLKVQDGSDSSQMIGRPDAALLTRAGRFYFQVGMNEVFTLGQAAWCGAPFVPEERYREKIDSYVELINDQGQAVLRYDAMKENDRAATNAPKQVDAIVRHIASVAAQNDIAPKPLWHPMLEGDLTLDALLERCPHDAAPNAVSATIGMVDDPAVQAVRPLKLRFSELGNALVFGTADSGLDLFAHAAVDALCRAYTPEQLNLYILDFDTESATMFATLPQVGNVVIGGEVELTNNLIQMLNQEYDRRRKACASYGGNLESYRRGGGKPIPDILVVLENYSAFAEGYDALEDSFYRLTREGMRYGIYFLMTAFGSRNVRSRLVQNFKQIFALQLNDETEYLEVFGRKPENLPMERVGSGICRQDRLVEFQVALLAEADCENVYLAVRNRCNEYADRYQGESARRIPVMPENIYIETLCRRPEKLELNAVPVGIDSKTLEVVHWNLFDRRYNPVLYKDAADQGFMQSLAEMLAANPKRDVWVVDLGAAFVENQAAKYHLYAGPEKGVEAIPALFNEVLTRWNSISDAKSAGTEMPVYDEMVVLIPQLHNVLGSLDEQALGIFFDAVSHNRPGMNMSYVFSIANNETYRLNSAWRNLISKKHAVWLGGDVRECNTFLQAGNAFTVVAAPDDAHGYMLENGTLSLMKLLRSAFVERSAR